MTLPTKISNLQHEDLIAHVESVSLDPSMLLDQQAELIKSTHGLIVGVSQDFMEARTKMRVKLGELLIEHQKNVRFQKIGWEDWATEHFSNIGASTRKEYMDLAREVKRNSGLKKLYFLGVSRLKTFTSVMAGQGHDPETTEMVERFNLKRSVSQDSLDSKLYRQNFDKLVEYFNFKEKMAGTAFDKEKILFCIDAGETFTDADCDILKNLSSNPSDIRNYLGMKVLNNGSPLKDKVKKKQRESFLNLGSKMRYTINSYPYKL